MYKVVLYLFDKVTFKKISQLYEYFAKEVCRRICKLIYFQSNTIKSFQLAEEFILCLLSTVIGGLGRAPDKITMKSTGTSKTVRFEKMMHVGEDRGEWVGWLATPLGEPKKIIKIVNIMTEIQTNTLASYFTFITTVHVFLDKIARKISHCTTVTPGNNSNSPRVYIPQIPQPQATSHSPLPLSPSINIKHNTVQARK